AVGCDIRFEGLRTAAGLVGGSNGEVVRRVSSEPLEADRERAPYNSLRDAGEFRGSLALPSSSDGAHGNRKIIRAPSMKLHRRDNGTPGHLPLSQWTRRSCESSEERSSLRRTYLVGETATLARHKSSPTLFSRSNEWSVAFMLSS